MPSRQGWRPAFPCIVVAAVAQGVNPKQIVALAFLLLTLSPSAQNNIPTFKVETKSALVWDENFLESTASSIRDPLSGNEIHKLSNDGIEVSSRVGYERVSPSKEDKLINYTTTIANNTDSEASVQYGGVSVDGHLALPLRVAAGSKGLSKRDRKDTWDLTKMYCFQSGFASRENFISSSSSTQASTQIFTVRPKTSITISFVTKDPRTSAVLCSMDGCHLQGKVRYYVTVNLRDYVFVWSGRSVVYCGE
ncbi:MAG: hypothetical protein WAN65_19910 [Candidatus Sulfotelmatobacter sp.]